MNDHPDGETPRPLLPKHRLEALQDGVYAIAITLLVLELHLPEHEAIHTQADLLAALGDQVPRFLSWLMSFFVLGIFWHANGRAQSWMRHTDGPLAWIGVASLLFVSFMPFAASLVGSYAAMPVATYIYAGVMAGLGLLAMAQLHYLKTHPALCIAPIPVLVYRAAMVRSGGVVAAATLAAVITLFAPPFATLAFALMGVVSWWSGRIGRGRPAAAPKPH